MTNVTWNNSLHFTQNDNLFPAVDCGPPPDVNNTYALLVPATTYPTQLIFQCNIGHEFANGNQEENIVCHENATWSSIANCQRKDIVCVSIIGSLIIILDELHFLVIFCMLSWFYMSSMLVNSKYITQPDGSLKRIKTVRVNSPLSYFQLWTVVPLL